MKKSIFLIITIIAVFITSCSKNEIVDYTKPENLSGTTWKCTTGTNWEADIEYLLLVFTSTTNVELWTKLVNETVRKDGIGLYTISNDTISILFEDELLTGIINGEKINLRSDGNIFPFLRQ